MATEVNHQIAHLQVVEATHYYFFELEPFELRNHGTGNHRLHHRPRQHTMQWCEALSSRGHNGAKQSPPGDKFQKSGGLRASMANTPFHQHFKRQILSKWRILDIDYNDFQRRFQLCPSQVLNQSTGAAPQPHFWQNIRDIENFDFLESRFMKSREVTCHP